MLFHHIRFNLTTWDAVSTNPPNPLTPTGQNNPSSVLTMQVSVVVPEKLHGQKVKMQKEKKKNTDFLAFSASF